MSKPVNVELTLDQLETLIELARDCDEDELADKLEEARDANSDTE